MTSLHNSAFLICNLQSSALAQIAKNFIKNAIPDKRSTIYWNPRLSIGENGKAEIKYYNSDIAKKHLVVIEGMDNQGRLARFETILD